jgi:hypothetical protein
VGCGAHDDHGAAVGRPGALECLLKLGDVPGFLRIAAEGARVRDPVDNGIVGADVLQHVVVRGTSLADLQPVDDGVTSVVAEHHDELVALEGRAVQLRVEHQVGAVADERDDLTRLTRHPRPPRAGDLVSHGGVPVLAVERPDSLREPVDVHLPGQSPGRGQRQIVLAGLSVERSDDLGVREGPIT